MRRTTRRRESQRSCEEATAPFCLEGTACRCPLCYTLNGIAERVPSRRRASQPACQPARQAPRHPFKGADDLGALKAAHFQSRRRAQPQNDVRPQTKRTRAFAIPLPAPAAAKTTDGLLAQTHSRPADFSPPRKQAASFCHLVALRGDARLLLCRAHKRNARVSLTAAKRDSRDFRVRPNERLLHRVSAV